MPEVWRRGVFCELGAGDVDLEAFFAELGGYSGWLVRRAGLGAARRTTTPSIAIEAQAHNRRWLAEHAGL